MISITTGSKRSSHVALVPTAHSSCLRPLSGRSRTTDRLERPNSLPFGICETAGWRFESSPVHQLNESTYQENCFEPQSGSVILFGRRKVAGESSFISHARQIAKVMGRSVRTAVVNCCYGNG